MSLDKAIGAGSVRLSKKITRFINHQLKPYQITTEQWSVLRTLSESDQITQKELSERADKDQATLTKILDLLEKHLLIERVPNPNDRRSFLIAITSKGKRLSQEVAPYLNDIYKKLIRSIDEEKLTIYQEVMLSLEKQIDILFQEQNN
ncbi:MarR family winged helix-turn-helix transcriptional regulator [Salirhabdus sp. Marseille-P4669]|uniref:MarR family winged helix-turn-helix transcriptional regulator n=1 Tax=Salirhabdus sp. Marseille-P4669 TaxID=2042310 RepID=UPI000C7BA3E5|nr:MarR family transcriptional regulator [Salirhabdus sp. Marseille-P4669]